MSRVVQHKQHANTNNALYVCDLWCCSLTASQMVQA